MCRRLTRMYPSAVLVFPAMLLPQGNRRFSERSVEMNFASEFRPRGARVIWWALTQAEERTRGFDGSAYAGARGFLFQFKAVRERIETGLRFYAEHNEVRRLRHVAASPGAVLYVLPTITSWAEFYGGGLSLLSHTWLLDVHQLPENIRPPQRIRSRGPRRSGMHYIEPTPPFALRSQLASSPLKSCSRPTCRIDASKNRPASQTSKSSSDSSARSPRVTDALSEEAAALATEDWPPRS